MRPNDQNVNVRRKPVGNSAGASAARKRPPMNNESALKPHVLLYAGIAGVILLLGACMLVNILIGIRNIEVEGNVLSNKGELCAVAGINIGSGYFSYNTSESEKKILKNVPCVTKVKITRSVFGNVKIIVEEKKADFYTELCGEYFALTNELEVIRKTEDRSDFTSHGLIRLDLPEVKSAVLGMTIEYSDGDRDCSYLPGFLAELLETGIGKAGRLDAIKIKSKFDIYVVFDFKYLVSAGSYAGMTSKLSFVEKATREAQFAGDDKWVIEIFGSDGVMNIASRIDETLDFSYLK